MILEKDRNVTLLTHLSGFGNYFFPMGSILFPFIIRELNKGDSKFMDELTKDVVNFNLSYLLYTILLKLLVVPLFVGSLFENLFFFNRFNSALFEINFNSDNIFEFASLIGILAIIKFVLIVKASIAANKGEYYKYKYVIEFVK